jgi:hypothetical protein
MRLTISPKATRPVCAVSTSIYSCATVKPCAAAYSFSSFNCAWIERRGQRHPAANGRISRRATRSGRLGIYSSPRSRLLDAAEHGRGVAPVLAAARGHIASGAAFLSVPDISLKNNLFRDVTSAMVVNPAGGRPCGRFQKRTAFPGSWRESADVSRRRRGLSGR